LENIRFSDISMVAEGGGTAEEGAQRDVIEFDDETLDGWWPGIHIVEGREGVLPLHGFFARMCAGCTWIKRTFQASRPTPGLPSFWKMCGMSPCVR
jgi:hypothetical protein